MNLSIQHVTAAILRDFRRTWAQFGVTDLLTRIAGVALLAPLVALLLRLFLARGGGPALTDEDILLFLLQPAGLATLLIVGGISTAIALVGRRLGLVAGASQVSDQSDA